MMVVDVRAQRGSKRTTAAEPAQTDPVPRATGIVGLVGVAAIHFVQVVPTTEQTPWLGAGFVLLTLACVALAARLIAGQSRSAWVQVGVVNGSAILGYIFTRTFSTFIDNQDVGNWSENLGMGALLVEGLL
ncbi:MAG TPA: hypothetical protein VFV02_07610, partial [Acidimicrobiales bacterium]|nr:hypothetical protein [Acidimicrobiales bacterium]